MFFLSDFSEWAHIFIENGRLHAAPIIEHIAEKYIG